MLKVGFKKNPGIRGKLRLEFVAVIRAFCDKPLSKSVSQDNQMYKLTYIRSFTEIFIKDMHCK